MTTHSFLTKLTFGLMGLLCFSTAAMARDSTWLLGDDGQAVALTTFEHRAENGRATTVTLIYGEHLLRGELKDVDSGKITLKASAALPENNYIFKGMISIDYEKMQIKLKGRMTVGEDEIASYDTTIKCKQLGD